ncbi:hypothetical protein LTR04_003752 [Oleoguttula sp. CCFEE 6159]|nr:hypothetical protein LTR04_003752 [Oleoguttula sp. CCFEE 6159]
MAARKGPYAEESAEVEVLFANLEKLKGLTKKIQSSMMRLETSGKTVSDAIGPIHGQTQRLQTTNSNIDSIIAAIDRIREPLDQRNKEERILRSSPQKVGLTEYIASIDRTNQALANLRNSNLRSNQQAITELNALLKEGSQQLENVFRDMLREDSNPLEPVHYLTKHEPFPKLSEAKVSQLRIINSQVAVSVAQTSQTDSLNTPTAKIYSDVRSQYLSLSLQNLATSSISTARKTSPDAIYRQGTNAIGMYAQAMEGVYSAEYDNLCPIFSRDDWNRVYTATCRSSLNEFSKTLSELNTHIRNNIITDCYLAYEIIGIVTDLSLRLEGRTGELKHPMSEALKPVRETAKSSLSTLLNDTRNRLQQMMTLPTDGSPLPITTDTMVRLQTMTAYLLPLSSVMTSLGDGGWSNPAPASSSTSTPTLKSFDVGADGMQLFAHYASDTMDILYNNLETKARTMLKIKSLQGVFMANNVAIIDRMVRSSELQPLLTSVQPKIDGWRKKATAMYLDAWKEPSACLLDVQYTNRGARPPSTGTAVDSAAVLKQLSSKDKDAVKEKFRSFNTSFDDLVAKHKSFRMEKEVRGQLAREVQMFIEALYGRFWDRYHDIDKGKGKYVKYDKSQLASILASLG